MGVLHSSIPAIALVAMSLCAVFAGKGPHESLASSARRVLIAFAALLYLFAAIIVPLEFIKSLDLGPWSIPVAFATEIVLFAVPVTAATWWFILRRVTMVKPEGRYARFAGLVAFAVVPILVFFVTPAMFEFFLPREIRDVATGIELACAFAALIGYWAWNRYWYLPRHPELDAKLQQLRERRDAQARE